MKRLLRYAPLPAILLIWGTLLGQASILGVVSIQNSLTDSGKRQFVSNAQVWDLFDSAQKTATDIVGNFELVFHNLGFGETVSFDVEKEGLEVVNLSALTAIADQKDTVRITMAKPKYVSALRMKIYHVGKSAAEKALQLKIDDLKKQLAAAKQLHHADTAAINQLNNLIRKNELYWNNIEEQSEELARNYASINLDDASPLFKKAFELFQSGDLDSALEILTKVNLSYQVYQILKTRKKLEELTRSLNKTTDEVIEALLFKADLHKTKFETDSVLESYRLALLLDTSNSKVLFSIASYFRLMNENDSAINYYQKILKSPCSPILISVVLDNLGLIYDIKYQLLQAEHCFKESIKIDSQIYAGGQKQIWDRLAKVLIDLASHYLEVNNIDETVTYLKNAQQLISMVPKSDSNKTALLIVQIAYNTGLLFERLEDWPQARRYFKQTVELSRPLAPENLSQFGLMLANGLSHLGSINFETKDSTSPLNELTESLRVYQSLSGTGSLLYGAELARAGYLLGKYYEQHLLFDLGNFYFQRSISLYNYLVVKDNESFTADYGKMLREYGNLLKEDRQAMKGLIYLEKAYDIFQALYDSIPDRFQLEYAQILVDLSEIFHISEARQLYDTARVFTLQAIKILDKLNIERHNAFFMYEVTAYISLGITYNLQRDFDNSNDAYLKANTILRTDSRRTENSYLIEQASIHYDMADNLFDEGQRENSEAHYDSAIAIYTELSKGVHDKYEYLLGSCLNSMGICLEAEKKYDKAENANNKAIQIWNDLIKINPGVYEPQLSQTLMNFGVLWGERGNYKKAEYCLLKSLTIIKKYTKNPDHIYDNQYMWTLVDLGQDYEEEHKPELATPYYLEALDIFPYIRGPVAAGKKAMIFRLLGENYLHRKLYDKAKYNLTLSLGLYEEFHLTDQESTKYQNRIKEDLKKIDANVTH